MTLWTPITLTGERWFIYYIQDPFCKNTLMSNSTGMLGLLENHLY